MVIELRGVQFGLISKSDERAVRGFDLKSQVRFETKIAWHEVQLPLYYSHFELAGFSQYHRSNSRFVQKRKQKDFTSYLYLKQK